MRTIAVITTSRADYSHLVWPVRALREREGVAVRIIAAGPTLAPEFGRTVGQIEADRLPVDETVECLLSSDTDVGMAKTIGVATLGLADVLDRMRPDLLLIPADRYEMLAPASVALALRIPIVHLEGGEVSEGAIDHAVRNALTMMSHVHLTVTATGRRRVVEMGEEPWRVHLVGAPSLDHLRRTTPIPRDDVSGRIGLDLARPTIVVAQHPVTLADDTAAEAGAVFVALACLEHQVVVFYPNADAGSRRIIDRARRFCADRGGARLVENLDQATWWGLLRHARVILGNTSSGLIEAPSLGLPCVNVGRRQDGRERGGNVIDVDADADAIVAAVHRADDERRRRELADHPNPYGDGRASGRIADVLADVPLGERLLVKRTRPLTAPEPAGHRAI